MTQKSEPFLPSAKARRRLSMAARVGITLVALGTAAVFARRLQFDENISRLLPDTDDELSRGAAVLRSLLERMVIDVSGPPDSPLTVEELGRAADAIAASLLTSGHVTEAQASIKMSDALSVEALLRSRCARLLDAQGTDRLAEKTSRSAVEETMLRLARRLQEPDGALFAAHVADDPLGITSLALGNLATATATFRESRIVNGRILSKDGGHLLVLVKPSFPAADTRRTAELLRSLDASVLRLRGDPTFAKIQVRHTGAHRSTFENARQVRSDVRRTSLVGVLLIAAMVLLCFRRSWAALLAFLPAGFGGIFALGIHGLFQDSISALVGGFGCVLLGLTVDYGIHVLFRAERRPTHVSGILHPLLLCSATTVAALLALRISAIPAVRDIGTFSALGIAGATLFSIVALPAIAPRPKALRPPIIDAAVLAAWLRTRRVARTTLLLGVTLTPVLCLGLFRLSFEGDLSQFNCLSQQAREDEEGILQTWGGLFQLSTIAVRGDTLEAACRTNDQLLPLLERLKESGVIRAHASISGLLPALETQDARLRYWKSFWSPERVAELRSSLAGAVTATPFRPEAFEPLFAWLQTAPPPITLEDYAHAGLKPLLEDRVLRAGDSWFLSTPVFTEGWPQVLELKERLRLEAPEAFLLNKQVMVRDLSTRVRSEMGRFGAASLLVVFLMVFAWHGRIELAVTICAPVVLGLLWALGTLGWLGISVNLTNAMFVAFLFGGAVDYSVFLTFARLDRFRGGDDLTRETDASVILCALTTALGFGVLALAGHPVLYSIGITGLVGVLACLLTSVVFLPPIFDGIFRSPGPNGAPRLKNIYAGAWAFSTVLGKAFWFLAVRRHLLPAERRETAAIDTMRSIAQKIRYDLPVGKRIYTGAEPPHDSGPFIVISNHESLYDNMAILALAIPIHVLVKKWVWDAPVLGSMVRAAGYILGADLEIDELTEKVGSSLQKGVSVLIYPEGTRSGTCEMGRFHLGAFALARRLQAKILPIALANSWSVARRGAWWVGDHEVRIGFLDPMYPSEFSGEDADRQMARVARDRLLAEKRRLTLEASDGAEWLRIIAGMYRYMGPVVGHYAASKVKRDPLIRALPRLCPGDGPVLVVGCGYGLMTVRLALAYPDREITAVDIDSRKIRVGRAVLRESLHVSFIEGDFTTAEVPCTEVALLVDVLHYWPPETQLAMVTRTHDHLQRGGLLVFRDGCAGTGWPHHAVRLGEKFAGCLGFTQTHGRFHFRTLEGWCQLLEDCGFRVEELRRELGALSNRVILCRRE